MFSLFARLIISSQIILSFPLFCQAQRDSIDTSSFDNSAHHWYDITADDNVINPMQDRPRYKETEIKQIGDNILLYQKDNGGWPKNYDMRAILTFAQKDSIVRTKHILNTTFDNWTTHSHVDYLAKAFTLLKDPRYKQACIKGIEYILSAQYSNGGWPQFYPDTSGYRKYITFNDGVMAGIMTLLKKIADNDNDFFFVDDLMRNKVRAAFKTGLECILKCQIKIRNKATAWGQQHDNITLEPQWARTFEPPSICNGESAGVVKFLMSLDNPSADVISAVHHAVRWFAETAMLGIRIKEIEIDPIKYKYSRLAIDRVLVEDPEAPPIWARFYEPTTRKPIFCNRDGKIVYSLAEVQHERRAGYGWYTYAPQEVLNMYDNWLEKIRNK